DHVHVRAAGEQPLDLLKAHVAGPDDEAAPPRQLEAGDVERRLEHVGHAALVAALEPVLADARRAGESLGGHPSDGTGGPPAARPPGKIGACRTSDPRMSSCPP